MKYLHVFDLHGTLIDGNEDAMADILARIIKQPAKPLTPDVIAPMMGLPLEDIICQFVSDRTTVDELVIKFREISPEVTPKYIRPREGARDLLTWIKGRGGMTAVVTTANYKLSTKMLEWTNLRDFIDHVRGGIQGDIVTGKTNLIRELMQNLGPAKTYMLGDTIEDMKAGHAAGAVTILVRSKATPKTVDEADVELQYLTDYKEIVAPKSERQ